MNAILASSSEIYNSDYLVYLLPELEKLYKNAKEVLFIPFARPGGQSHDQYTEKARRGLKSLGKTVIGIHQTPDYKTAIKTADAIFVGGGNTFLLVAKLYEYDLIKVLRNTIKHGTPYLGTSAGSNICGITMQTTNDMPIILPKSFKTMGIVPFNFNVHYQDPDPNSHHRGETRETRIKEFQNLNNIHVIGLREGSWLKVTKEDILLQGNLQARVFACGKTPFEIGPNTSLLELHQTSVKK